MPAPVAEPVRFKVEPRDVPPIKAARRLHLTLEEFEAYLPELRRRGFPAPDPTTKKYDLKKIDEWMDERDKPVSLQDRLNRIADEATRRNRAA